ncbi:MAG: DUF3006 domain-containing protein [Patescibacteria group bacterium]
MTIKIVIDRFENDKAVLKTEDGQTIIWPKAKLPSDSKEGAVLNFIISSNQQTEDEKKEMAKNILNEILDVTEN